MKGMGNKSDEWRVTGDEEELKPQTSNLKLRGNSKSQHSNFVGKSERRVPDLVISEVRDS